MSAPPVLVMAAPNGARKTKADHPNLPMTPAELAAEAGLCRDAGAAALHMHVRDANGAHSLDADLYRRNIDVVRDVVGDALVLQITTEAVGRYTPGEQIACVRAVEPEAVSIGLREILPEGDDPAAARDLFAWMREAGVWAQVILYDAADVARFVRLHGEGVFAVRRPSVLLVLGRYTPGQRSQPGDLDPLLDALAPLREDTDWSVCAFGPQENACMAHAFSLGGHARVGFENNLFLPDGEHAERTADLVALAVDAARRAGRPLLDAPALRRRIGARPD